MSRSFTLASRTVCLGLMPILLSSIAVQAQNLPREPEAFLRTYAGLSQVEQSAVERGESVAKLVDIADKRELAVCGIVRLAISADGFAARIRDIVEYKKNDAILQIGLFSDTPRLEDLDGLTIEADDLKALKDCKVGDCDVRLPAKQIDQFRSEIDWKRADSSKRANALARQMLLQYVTAYLAGGTDKLAEYGDRKRALRLADESRSLMAASPLLTSYAPELRSYLESFPSGTLEKVENVVYWSKEKFGLKPVVSVTHMTIYTVRKAGVANVIVSSRQIYASRYFDSSLALTVLVEAAPVGQTPTSYLVYLNRSRTDQLGGILGSAKRSFVEGRMVRGVRTTLKVTKDRLEKGYREQVASAGAAEASGTTVRMSAFPAPHRP